MNVAELTAVYVPQNLSTVLERTYLLQLYSGNSR